MSVQQNSVNSMDRWKNQRIDSRNPRRRQGFMRVNKLENKSHEKNSNKERNENLKLKIETIDE